MSSTKIDNGGNKLDKTTGETSPPPKGFKRPEPLPTGFELVSTAALPPVWVPKENDFVVGDVLQCKQVTITQNRKTVDTKYMVVEDNGVQHTFWQSAGLVDLFSKAEIGDQVYIKYVGLVDTGNKQNPMKGYECGIKKREAKDLQ